MKQFKMWGILNWNNRVHHLSIHFTREELQIIHITFRHAHCIANLKPGLCFLPFVFKIFTPLVIQDLIFANNLAKPFIKVYSDSFCHFVEVLKCGGNRSECYNWPGIAKCWTNATDFHVLARRFVFTRNKWTQAQA